ncbi:MAG: hydroxymethylbilane synthase [Rubripirellula sp.]
MKTLRIATRKSPLALWQAEHIAKLLSAAGVVTELVPMVSGGDTDMRPIDGTRQVGLFTKRIQQALLEDEADIAVHSLKDLPTEANERLLLAAVPERETVSDSLVSEACWTLSQLPQGARVGTGSRRRAAQLWSQRDDLVIEPIRGNVQTRLSKLESGEFDAIVLAEAGIARLEMHDLNRTQFSLSEMLPAPGQGALGIEVRRDDSDAIEAVASLEHIASRSAVTAERKLLAALHGGCLAPIAAFGSVTKDGLTLKAVALSQDGKQRIDQAHSVEFDPNNWAVAADEVAGVISNAMTEQGAIEMIR